MTIEETIKVIENSVKELKKQLAEYEKDDYPSEQKETFVKKYKQIIHRREKILQMCRQERRRKRNHRLIQRGAILESVLPIAPEEISNDEILSLLKIALESEQAQEHLRLKK